MLTSREVFFYLWLPIGLGLFMGATEAGRTTEWPLAPRLAYFVTICCVDWWIVDFGCRLCKMLLRPWRPSFWVILLAGSLVAAILVIRPVNWLLIQAWHAYLPPGMDQQPMPSLKLWGHLDELIAGLAPWLLANYLVFRLGYLPRYGFVPQVSSAQPPDPATTVTAGGRQTGSGILNKVKPERRGELLALNAQGHYLRVITSSGEDLILYRFGDAVDELAEDTGLQVHRSWWVSRNAIENRESLSAKQLRLGNGLTVPVSRTYQRELDKLISA